MLKAKLIINGEREVAIERDVTSLGRTADNTVALSSDSNVSRYHAEIERRGGGEFWLIELGSSNGTTVNGARLTPHEPHTLRDGDEILLGKMMVKVLFQARKRK